MAELDPVHNGETSDSKEDEMAVARAYQAASDDDTRKTLNVMSSKASTSLESIKYYIVPAAWFLKAWPFLMARSADEIKESRDRIGRIGNAELLDDVEHAVSSSDEEEDNNHSNNIDMERQKRRFERKHRKAPVSTQQRSMRKGLSHKRDFFFLGPSAWMVVKEKFGFDGHELGRDCTFVGDSQNSVAVKLHGEEVEDNKSSLVVIPHSGRFPYEKVVAKTVNDPVGSSDVVSEEDEEGVEMFPWSRNLPETENVTSTSEEPILLLPASTTATHDGQSSSIVVANNIQHSADEMEVDSGIGDNDSKTSSPCPVAPATTSRKRYASGLANMGNTCFMNSTIQCLAHTEPIRRYFLSGDYENELNRDNPLGTGGELATQFAHLLSEMWGVSTKRRNILGSSDYFPSATSSSVYPRNFKYTLGRHAEQFLGYDQHDSQELATYLLDALHEDTNRVTKKPYVEKPEQGEDEPDDVAADKAWRLHLQRDDSKVLENFMGQVKSRLECCEEGCNRVSTTFDPFMYLSVPIPGGTDRTLKVTFVPLDPAKRMVNLKVTMGKTANVGALLGKVNEQLVNHGVRTERLPQNDLIAIDVFKNLFYAWYPNDKDIDDIKDSDETFIYELLPLSAIHDAVDSKEKDTDRFPQAALLESRTKNRSQRFKLDVAAMTKLNRGDDWKKVLENYMNQPFLLIKMFNPNRVTVDELLNFHQKLENFIDLLHKETTEEESTGLKRSREESEESDENESSTDEMVFPTGETIQGLVDRTDASTTFKNVKNKHDVAILEFCSNKVRQFTQNMIKMKQDKHRDGITIQIAQRRSRGFYQKDNGYVYPLALRIPPTMTVHGLREELAKRLSRSLRLGRPSLSDADGNSGESSSEAADKEDTIMKNQDSEPFGSPALQLMRQIPLSYTKKNPQYYSSNILAEKQLGMLSHEVTQTTEGGRRVSFATPADDDEQELVCDIVGQNGTVFLNWPQDLVDSCFDTVEFQASENLESEEDGGIGSRTRLASKATTVMDCIEKYCQMEQLEETEMWYCNSCKKHVRAWKQFHIYRSPPILIVHLKRFHYSPSTHRRDKISAMIDFPLEGLDLREVVSHWTEAEKPIYDCYAVSNHYGGLGGGHYTAHILSDEGNWMYYDDSRVNPTVDASEVRSEAAYVLYYRRRDVPVGEDFYISDGQTPALVVDQPENSTEISSNNTAQAGDDDMVVEDTDGRSVGSSRTCPSPMGSADGADDPFIVEGMNENKISSVVSGEDFPLQ